MCIMSEGLDVIHILPTNQTELIQPQLEWDGLDSRQPLTNVNKNEHLLSHDIHIGQEVMYQDATSKQCYPATINSSCVQPRSYNITTRESVTYRKTQAHLKPYQSQSKKSEDEYSAEQSSDMWTLQKADHKQFNDINNLVQPYSRPKRDIKPPVKLDW